MEGGYSKEAMMKQAQQVWSMLDDMADNDPAAYKTFIDKQRQEKKEFVSPAEPHMCVQTSMVKPQNATFYINFCTWKRIPEQANAEEPVKVAGSAIGQLNDEKGKIAVTAVAFNEKILHDYGKNSTNTADQDTLIQIAMDFIEKQHSHIKLNRKYKILERTHKGSVKMIQESLFQAFRTKDKDVDGNIADMLKEFAPLGMESPQSLLGQLNKDTNPTENHNGNGASDLGETLSGITLNTKPVKTGLIEVVSNGDGTVVSIPEPVYDLSTHEMALTLKIQLPGVKSVTECELDISKDDVSLLVEEKYELKLSLPKTIDDASATAKFNKKSSVLILKMPLEPPNEINK